jgi:hypothetical protein
MSWHWTTGWPSALVVPSAPTMTDAHGHEPDAEADAADRILERVSAELPEHDAAFAGRLAEVVLLVSEGDDEQIAVALANSHEEAVQEVAAIEPSGQAASHIRARLAKRPPMDLPVIVVLVGGSIFYRSVICVPRHGAGKA